MFIIFMIWWNVSNTFMVLKLLYTSMWTVKNSFFQNLIIMAYLVIILKSKENIISETSMIW